MMPEFRTSSFFSAPPRPLWRRYAVAVALVLLGWLARQALSPAIGPTALPFIFFFPTVAVAAWYGGAGPGALTAILAAMAADWFFIEPVHGWALAGFGDFASLGAFLLSCVVIIVAIQAMHRARALFAGQKELLATTLRSIGDAVIATNHIGEVTFMNPEAERLTGWNDAAALGRPLPEVFRIVNERTRQPVPDPVAKVIRDGMVVGLANHTILLARDGRETPIDDSAAPIRQHGGPLAGVVLVFRDVTEQRRAYDASERLAAIVQHSGDVILTKNLDGIIQTWNASAERLLGYRSEEIIGKPATTLMPPERLDEEDYILGSLRQGKAVERFETECLTKDGRRVPVAVAVSPLKDAAGQITGASKIIHDISDLVAARQALQQEKQLLATTLASIGDAVVVTNVEGRVTFLNEEAERLTKWSRGDAVGRPLPEIFHIVNEHTRERVESPVEKVLRSGTIVGLANHTILIGRDGTEIPIDDSAAPIRESGGPLSGVVLVFRDFTERRKAEEALRVAHAQLADRSVHLEKVVEERTAKLRDVVNELQHVSYAIVHDMRAPLRAMNMFAGVILEHFLATPELHPELQDYCRRLLTAAARLDKLIQDSLNYTTTVLREVPLQPVDLAVLIPGLIQTYPNLQPDRADIIIEEQLPVVLGEESLLTQCFSNLLGNAVKFVPPGVRPKIRVRAQQTSDFIRITVEDNGIGISRQAQSRLFGMFERLTADYEGTGIGLAIVRKVAERMGGRVGADSEPGKGSRFWVELRRVDGEETVRHQENLRQN